MSESNPTTAPSGAPPPEANGAKAENLDTGRGPRGSLAQDILGGPVMVSFLSVIVALVLSGVIIAAIDPAVREASSYFFARPMDTLSAAWAAVRDAYLALFRGAIFDYNAETVARQIKPVTDTFFYAIPLIVAGLGLAVGFRAGLFNIGAQGQVILGAMFAGWIGFSLDLPVGIHLLLAIAAGALGGALWASIAGVLKARTGANEVIVTIMLNSIAALLIAWTLKQDAWQVPGSNEPRSPFVAETAAFPLIFPAPLRLHWGLLLALICVALVWWILERSTFGFELRATGANPNAADHAGVSTGVVVVGTMALAGALAGLAGATQVLGDTKYLTAAVAGSVGFDAITVALLGRSRPVGTLVAGILFGALKAGSFAMSREGVPVDIVAVVQAVVVLLIAAPPLVRWIFRLPTPGAPRRRQEATA